MRPPTAPVHAQCAALSTSAGMRRPTLLPVRHMPPRGGPVTLPVAHSPTSCRNDLPEGDMPQLPAPWPQCNTPMTNTTPASDAHPVTPAPVGRPPRTCKWAVVTPQRRHVGRVGGTRGAWAPLAWCVGAVVGGQASGATRVRQVGQVRAAFGAIPAHTELLPRLPTTPDAYPAERHLKSPSHHRQAVSQPPSTSDRHLPRPPPPTP